MRDDRNMFGVRHNKINSLKNNEKINSAEIRGERRDR